MIMFAVDTAVKSAYWVNYITDYKQQIKAR